MEADFSVELGPEDDCLEMPWTSADGSVRYFNLRAQPELLLEISEAMANQDLGEFLSGTNTEHSMVETAKCDTWVSQEISEAEKVYGVPWKFGSYIDLIFSDAAPRLSFPKHEELARRMTELLGRAPRVSAAAEFVIRRCYYHPDGAPDVSDHGFCITFYLHGYGDDEIEARQRWTIGLRLVQNALLQISAAYRR
jgi:hypothetical protein